MQLQRELEIITEIYFDYNELSESWKGLCSKIKAFSELEGTRQNKVGELLRKHAAEQETFTGI